MPFREQGQTARAFLSPLLRVGADRWLARLTLGPSNSAKGLTTASKSGGEAYFKARKKILFVPALIDLVCPGEKSAQTFVEIDFGLVSKMQMSFADIGTAAIGLVSGVSVRMINKVVDQ